MFLKAKETSNWQSTDAEVTIADYMSLLQTPPGSIDGQLLTTIDKQIKSLCSPKVNLIVER